MTEEERGLELLTAVSRMGVGRNGANWKGDGPETGMSTTARRTRQGGVWEQHPIKRKSLEGQQGGSRPTSWGGGE